MPEEVFFLIFRFLCLGKCFFLSSSICAWGSASSYLQVSVPGEVVLFSSYLQVPVPREVLLLILR